MKANELMVGDLIYDKANDDYGEVTGVIDNGEIYIDGVIAYIADCTPIPLTSEILEKNGFEYNLDRGVYMLGIIFQVKPERNGMFSISICGCPQLINTVHKLQHALKLCRIEKTIEL